MIEKWLGKFIDFIGYLSAFVFIAMMFNVAYDVVMRYAFENSSIAMQELEWHLFSAMILFGVGYALKEDAHVRVDFLYDRFSPKSKAIINIFGTLFFLIPLALLITYGSYEFVMDSFMEGEISGDPGGLTHRWIVKAMIPLSFLFLILCAVYDILRNIRLFRGLS